ncbi:MAG TPA: YceI family protein [Verrucomicrobiae bacterium]|jgi:polyisoprenoid-binding protein YceI|nr:YceI family protein [Verrucomicrobiae bacterium]
MKVCALAFGTLLGISLITAQAQTSYSTQPTGCDIKIDGTSSLHDWEMEGSLIGGFIEFGPGVVLDPTQTGITGIQGNTVSAKAKIIIPVDAIHSKADHMPDTMDRLMQQALKESDFPRIVFVLTGLTFKGPHAVGKPFNFDATGNLAIAGKTNVVTFPVKIECPEEGKLKISGSVPVKMTDYGVTPPAPNFGLGLMKVGEDVQIIFDWMVHKRK